MLWPPSYPLELARRLDIERRLMADPRLQAAAKLAYAQSITDFVSDCVWIAEPRNVNSDEPVKLPVVLFPRQRQFLEWLVERFKTKTSAPVEKSRDSGATWMSCAFAVWLWLFYPGSTVGFGSRKEILVDRAGDMQSIFEKIRSIIENLPPYMKPRGFNERSDSTYMKLLNPENGATIIGEAGDNIGRGGRTSVYFVDEAAHLDHPERIEAALTATTDVRIDISSPRVGSLFNQWVSKRPRSSSLMSPTCPGTRQIGSPPKRRTSRAKASATSSARNISVTALPDSKASSSPETGWKPQSERARSSGSSRRASGFIAERIDALGPRFRLPFLAVQAVEARSGRQGVLAFACDQDDLAVKLVAALIADVPATVHLLTEYTTVTNEWPPNTRRLKRLSRRVDKILATMKARLEA